ncbi:MAG: TSUP family transporter [Campylobacteraceae bacterium]|nr:TSUP family transporter [Campylobacteraceae bacterium]
MEAELVTFLIVCPLVFLAGLIDAIAGGGGLISVPAYLFAGLPPHFALGTNKLSSTIGTAVAAFRYYKNGFVDMAICLPSIAAALVGSAIGAHLALYTDEEVLRKILMALLPLIAIYILKNKNLNARTSTLSRQKTFIYSAIISFTVGLYDGFFGPGTGTFMVLGFISIVCINPRTATGNTKIINLASNLSALSVFLYNGYVSLALGLTAGAFSILGSYIGAGLAIKKGSNIIRYAILFVLALLFVKVGWDLVGESI